MFRPLKSSKNHISTAQQNSARLMSQEVISPRFMIAWKPHFCKKLRHTHKSKPVITENFLNCVLKPAKSPKTPKDIISPQTTREEKPYARRFSQVLKSVKGRSLTVLPIAPEIESPIEKDVQEISPSLSLCSGLEEHNVWPDDGSHQNKIDIEKGNSIKDGLDMFNLFKARFEEFPTKKEPICSLKVISSLQSLELRKRPGFHKKTAKSMDFFSEKRQKLASKEDGLKYVKITKKLFSKDRKWSRTMEKFDVVKQSEMNEILGRNMTYRKEEIIRMKELENENKRIKQFKRESIIKDPRKSVQVDKKNTKLRFELAVPFLNINSARICTKGKETNENPGSQRGNNWSSQRKVVVNNANSLKEQPIILKLSNIFEENFINKKIKLEAVTGLSNPSKRSIYKAK